VRRQSYPRREHIVMDGGSTDGTLEILEAAARASPLTWRSEPDDGMYDAINRGFRLAEGDVLGYLNSDDRLAPWALETVVRVFEADPGVGVVFGDAVELSPAGVELKLQIPFRADLLGRYGSLAQPAVFWRRELLERHGGFDSALRFVGDLEYWLRLARTEQFEHLTEVLAAYLVHPAAKTSRHRAAMRQEEMQVRARYGAGASPVGGGSLAARISHGWAVRRQLLRFLRATRSPGDPRWARFRGDAHPRIRPLRLVAALLPLAGRRRPTNWLALRDGWLANASQAAD
jgi:glycosyltransferase involved in cell wall biosynthesis